MKEERRSQVRCTEQLVVKFGTDHRNRLGFVSDISRDGLKFKSQVVLAPGAVLDICVDVAAGRSLELVGEVRWCREFSHVPAQKGYTEVGIKLLGDSPEYREFVRQHIARKNRRHEQLVIVDLPPPSISTPRPQPASWDDPADCSFFAR